jgi:hypothetical protein
MDKVYLRSLFVQEKDFLKKLYDGQGNALTFASDKSLNTLIKILHLIAEGHIPMRKQDKAEIKTAKKFNSLNKFASKTFFAQITKTGTRETKLKELKQFLKLYPLLLHTFFNEI